MHTSSKGSERESEIALQNYFSSYSYCSRIYIHIYIHTHIHTAVEYFLFYSAKYNRTERLCILAMVAGCYVHTYFFLLRCMLCYNQDATIRPVLKHGPRSSTGLRVVEYITKLIGGAKAKLCEVYIFIHIYCSTGWLRICIELCSVCILLSHTLLCRDKRLIKLKSTLVETRKMVNYARTWWSQVKTWWKLALCGTDVQIVAAWPEYRGERLIEPSSSWFPPKFPSG